MRLIPCTELVTSPAEQSRDRGMTDTQMEGNLLGRVPIARQAQHLQLPSRQSRHPETGTPLGQLAQHLLITSPHPATAVLPDPPLRTLCDPSRHPSPPLRKSHRSVEPKLTSCQAHRCGAGGWSARNFARLAGLSSRRGLALPDPRGWSCVGLTARWQHAGSRPCQPPAPHPKSFPPAFAASLSRPNGLTDQLVARQMNLVAGACAFVAKRKVSAGLSLADRRSWAECVASDQVG